MNSEQLVTILSQANLELEIDSRYNYFNNQITNNKNSLVAYIHTKKSKRQIAKVVEYLQHDKWNIETVNCITKFNHINENTKSLSSLVEQLLIQYVNNLLINNGNNLGQLNILKNYDKNLLHELNRLFDNKKFGLQLKTVINKHQRYIKEISLYELNTKQKILYVMPNKLVSKTSKAIKYTYVFENNWSKEDKAKVLNVLNNKYLSSFILDKSRKRGVLQ